MKICIIKLGALGDVIRTIPILEAIKSQYPESKITWITKKASKEILERNPSIDEVLTPPLIIKDTFDILYSLDIEEDAMKLASDIQSIKKYGFYSKDNYPASFNISAEYYLNTLFDDELKKTNKKTYQEMIFGAAELPWDNQKIRINLSDADRNYSQEFLIKNKIKTGNIIGIHIGSSPRWPSKSWHSERILEFIKCLKKESYDVLLFAGPDDLEKQKEILGALKEDGIYVATQDPYCTISQFASLMSLCNQIICSDSLALHISLAMKKPTIGLFFCTSPEEVEGYGLLNKIVSPMLYDFFPEKMDQYSEALVKSITSNDVLKALKTYKPFSRVVNALILDEDKFLVIKRKSGIHAGKWAFPGGIVEPGETEEQALKREVMEEVGLIMEGIVKKISSYNYPRDNGETTRGNCYIIKVRNKKLKINDEIEEARFVNLEELQGLDYLKEIEEEAMEALYPKSKNR